jgi:hypothetical protein
VVSVGTRLFVRPEPNQSLTAPTTDAITAYFQTPAEDERFNVLRHEQA